MYQHRAEQGTWPLRLICQGRGGKENHLPFDTVCGFFPLDFSCMSSFVSVIGKPGVRGFDRGCRAHISILLGMLKALKRQRGRTGAWVSANLVGRWLTSPCPSKYDLGHTFNEIHSTWQAPPLPGMSVWSPALFQSFCWAHVLLLCICCVCLCVCVCVCTCVCSNVSKKEVMVRPPTKTGWTCQTQHQPVSLLLSGTSFQVQYCFQ